MIVSESIDTNNSRVIIITGAGASAYLGYPTLESVKSHVSAGICSTSAAIVRDLWEELDKKGEKANLEQVISHLHHYLNASKTFIEDIVFKRLIDGKVSFSNSANICGLFKEALDFCYRVMLEKYGPFKCCQINCDVCPFKPQCDRTISFLNKLCDFNSGKIHLFTTNYDCSLKTLGLKREKLNIVDHIDANGFFCREWFISSSEKNKVYLHNLHGCVTWSTDSERGHGGVTEVIRIPTGLDPDQCPVNKMGIKLVTDERIQNPAFAIAFQELREALAVCECIVVWGHSFRDTELLRAINEENLKRNIPIVNLNLYHTNEILKRHIISTLDKVPVNIGQYEIQDVKEEDLRDDFVDQAIDMIRDVLG